MNKMQFAKFLSKLLLCHLHFLHWKIARLQPKVERNSNYFCWGNYALKLHSITREAISSGFLNFPQILLRILVNKLVQDTLHHISRGCRMSSPKWLMIFTSVLSFFGSFGWISGFFEPVKFFSMIGGSMLLFSAILANVISCSKPLQSSPFKLVLSSYSRSWDF